ncbi:MAG TPA: hypothetical protein VGE27_10365 [Gemmatimonas sp.]|uniref:hypothetical protein n=1 Tax=Gemmatimonas sp. TaxID=1962908 RepID=UPI002ED91F71
MTWRLVLASVALIPAALSAQPRGGDGFLFRRPAATVSLRLGAGQPSASSDVFDFVSKDLTVGRSDFLGVSFMADLSVPLSQRLELQFSGGTSGRRANSEYGGFVDNDDLPIEQSTSFRRVPLAVGLKWNLLPAGRQISRLAWVPSRFVPYVAAGGGTTYYQFRQSGDFIDFADSSVFTSTLKSSGWGALGYGAAGATFNMSRSVGLITEVRYDVSNASLRGDFQNFDPISLSGVGVTAGFQFRF